MAKSWEIEKPTSNPSLPTVISPLLIQIQVEIPDPENESATPETITVEVIRESNGDVTLQTPEGIVRVQGDRAILPDGRTIYLAPREISEDELPPIPPGAKAWPSAE